jgi:hypothetical protein
MFPNIKKNKITNYESHEKYKNIKSNESSINDKVQSSYSECILKETKQPILKQHFFVKHDVQ